MKNVHEQFSLALCDVARGWRTTVNERLKPLGLSQAKWLTFMHLSRCKKGIIQKELAQLMGIEGPTLVRLLDRLEADGWVERRGLASDRRSKLVFLSDKAAPLVIKIRKIVNDLRTEVLSAVPYKELTISLAVLRRIHDRIKSL